VRVEVIPLVAAVGRDRDDDGRAPGDDDGVKGAGHGRAR
jgi:hypothetical protein